MQVPEQVPEPASSEPVSEHAQVSEPVPARAQAPELEPVARPRAFDY